MLQIDQCLLVQKQWRIFNYLHFQDTGKSFDEYSRLNNICYSFNFSPNIAPG